MLQTRPFSTKFPRASFFVSVAVLAIGLTANAQVRTIALTETDPGTHAGEFFSSFDPPRLNDFGQVAFTAQLQNAEGTLEFANNYGVWSHSHGQLRNIARRNLVPLAEPVFAPCWEPVHLTNANRTLFYASLEATNMGSAAFCANSGLWSDDQGVLENVIDRSVPLDGAGGEFSQRESGHAVNRSEEFVFYAMTTGPVHGVWYGDGSTTRLIVKVGEDVPAINNEERRFWPATSSIFGGSYLINEHGTVAVHGEAYSTDDSPSSREGIWLDDGGLKLVVMAGEEIGNLPGAVFDRLNWINTTQIHLSDDGELFFTGWAQRGVGGITSQNDEGLYVSQNGELRVIAREGELAPGTNAPFGGSLVQTFRSTAINRQGDIVFAASGGENGVWVERDGELKLVARVGLPFLHPIPSDPFVAINDNRQVAFVDESTGLIAENLTGQLITIAALGEQLEIAPGDFRTLTDVGFAGNSGFNALGQIAFQATFDDGSRGIFVSDAVMVPEPATCFCVVCWLWVLMARGRAVT